MAYRFAGQWSDSMENTLSGVPYRSTQFTVFQSDGVTAATLYTDRTKALTAANPATTDIYGNAVIYADPGLYVINMLGVAFAIEIRPDPSETHVNGSAAEIIAGTGSPAGVVAAAVGSIFLRTDGGSSTTLYVKESGGSTTSGWVAK